MPYQQQNQHPRNRVNTDGLQFYGDTSTLRLDFWSQCICAKIHPKRDDASMSADPNSRAVYDYKKRLMVVLPVESALTLGRYIKEEIVPAILKKEQKAIGIQSSRVNMIYVSTGVKETGNVEPYVALFCDIDENRKPQKMDIFKFRSRRIFKMYDPQTGEVEMEENLIADVQSMADFLLSAVFLGGVTSHAFDYAHAVQNESNVNFFSDLGAKMGVAYQQPTNIVSRSAMKADPWSTSKQQEAAAEPAPSSTISSLDDINALVSKSTYKKLKKRLITY
jgi:hypothetical protein